MAEIAQQGGGKHSAHKVRVNRKSTRIDMTPMVDLAFLLLTFFILTSAFNKGYMMTLDMPQKEGTPPMVNEQDVLNIVLAENNKVYWWMGLEPTAQQSSYSSEGIRKVLLERRQPKLVVLIKPMDNSKYENMVDLLDEIAITETRTYAIVDFTDDDQTRLPPGNDQRSGL
jgi:biopolymer transport protein ExbD